MIRSASVASPRLGESPDRVCPESRTRRGWRFAARSRLRDRWLLASGALALAGALLHLAVPFGGPAWYTFLGAPPRLAAMAEAGSFRAALTCVVIAMVLLIVALYALSGLGLVRRLPLLRTGLAAIGVVLVTRGVAFIPLVLWYPRLLSGLCGRCEAINPFVVVTSALCLFAGVGFLLGAARPVANPAHARGATGMLDDR